MSNPLSDDEIRPYERYQADHSQRCIGGALLVCLLYGLLGIAMVAGWVSDRLTRQQEARGMPCSMILDPTLQQ